MAQLGNTVVNGSLRVIGDFYANGYIDTTVTLTSSGWSGTDLFTQKVNVAGVKADNNYRVYQYISSGATAAEIKTYLKNFSYVVSGYATPADGSITFTTIKKPTANVTVRIVGDSNVERTTVENSEVTSMKSDIASINTSLNTLNTRIGDFYISHEKTDNGDNILTGTNAYQAFILFGQGGILGSFNLMNGSSLETNIFDMSTSGRSKFLTFTVTGTFTVTITTSSSKQFVIMSRYPFTIS